MDNVSMINAINSELGNHKDEFLQAVRTEIQRKIKSKSSADCLTVVEKRDYQNIIWKPSKALDGYIPRFIAFLRKKKHKNNELDSVLTDEVVGVVVSAYSDFVQKHSALIVKPILKEVLKDGVIINTIANSAVSVWKNPVSEELKRHLVVTLVHKIEDSLSVDIVHASSQVISTSVTKIMATTAAIPITKSIALLLSKHMAVLLKGVVVKILASSAFKTMMTALVKKFVAAKVLSIIVAAIGTKLAGISVSYILAPLILAFIAYEVYTLPEKMAKNISDAVVGELSGEFSNLNAKVSSKIMAEVGGLAVGAFVHDVVNDVSMKELLDSIK